MRYNISMSDLKTKPTKKSPKVFIGKITHETRKNDALVLLDLFSRITKEEPIMWGDSIIGFGIFHYKYSSGREGDWPIVGFSPRKNSLSIYLMSGLKEELELLEKLGKHKIGVGCLYINRLSDIDLKVLSKLIKKSYNLTKNKYH